MFLLGSPISESVELPPAAKWSFFFHCSCLNWKSADLEEWTLCLVCYFYLFTFRHLLECRNDTVLASRPLHLFHTNCSIICYCHLQTNTYEYTISKSDSAWTLLENYLTFFNKSACKKFQADCFDVFAHKKQLFNFRICKCEESTINCNE